MDDEVERDFAEFWSGIVSPDGALDIEQVKRELYDYHQIMQNTSKVYDEITCGKVTKPNTDSGTVIALFEDYVSQLVREEKERVPEAAQKMYDVLLPLEKILPEYNYPDSPYLSTEIDDKNLIGLDLLQRAVIALRAARKEWPKLKGKP